MYEWHSLDHVALSDSYASAAHASRTTPFDYFHINSVDVRGDGDLLVDARNTWAAYDVDARSGRVRWRLGGKHSSFAMGRARATAWQHDAREQPDGTITFFDNGATPAVHSQSRAIDVRLDAQRMTATLVREDDAPGQGAGRRQPGQCAGAGRRRMDGRLGRGSLRLGIRRRRASWCSTRTCRRPMSPTAPTAWRGAATPSTPPALAVVRAACGHGATVYASWNGATEVASWRVLGGRVAAAPRTRRRKAARSGFETAIVAAARRRRRLREVQALDAAGAVIGVSRREAHLSCLTRLSPADTPPCSSQPFEVAFGAAFARGGGVVGGVLGDVEVVGEASA